MTKSYPRFYIFSEDEIKKGYATDIYFIRSKQILEKYGLCNKVVRYEIHVYGLPSGYKWALYTGLEEAVSLLQGIPATFYSVPEGTIFTSLQPLAILEGKICDIITIETALLGILRFYSSVSTKAARIKKKAGDKQVIFFGLRVQHPAIAPALDRAAYIGGCDAVSGAFSKDFLGIEPKGTIPHALILVFGDPVEAWKAFDNTMPENVPRIALVDTFYDERYESLLAAKTLGKRLWGVRLDTPRSRRGDIRLIAQEVKWTLKLHGFEEVKIVISGGLDENDIERLKDVADVFGVGTSIAFPPSIDLSMDIVEIYDVKEGKWIPITKRGKLPGAKQLYRCKPIIEDYIDMPGKVIKCKDGEVAKPMLNKIIENGKLLYNLPKPDEIRQYVLEQLKYVDI
ncbi:nicotinate phosphoribosyltransferase [Ignisphaera sp. 4213-co]|uniref:Nicotinate phosphoribosyltransferase n=1 Tax=Ignisphaera cupida TaxID=3050454 RepID=A0ABD4Z8Q9_9CREN|nr:nicotinate phosphoribosyltransferase [Ignisphaera sp. 4213-co]MDK6029312.1 nicotinate phosphoribosyltransferase [Ignisphaera sp. 4213-co]